MTINICIICRKTSEFIDHLAVLRGIDGIKVLKRRNKPFYDITGTIGSESDFRLIGQTLSYLITNCGAELVIDDTLSNIIFVPLLINTAIPIDIKYNHGST